MTIYFDPPAPPPANAEYYFAEQGEVLQFTAVNNYFASALLEDPPDPLEPDAPFLAYQMMAGTMYSNCSEGDPMMLQAPFLDQLLDHHWFATHTALDFDYDHIVVVRELGTEVTLDCLGVLSDSDFDTVGASAWEVAQIFIDDPGDTTDCVDGLHEISADGPIGVSVVGTTGLTSYGYLGSTGLLPINPVPAID
jgi:hypothetical protein